MDDRHSIKPGDVIGDRYRIDKVLGFGGMGVVYKATDLKLNVPVALKMLRSKAESMDLERLRQEILLARKVTHENVCRVYDLEEIDGEEYISMELLKGESIKEIQIRKGLYSVGQTLNLLRQILRGLAAAHKMGVIHCDLKPENIMVDETGHLAIMDFGISRAVDQPIEKGAPIMGTPEFLSPEQIRGKQVDGRTDLYSVGVIVYEMLTGEVPFEDTDVYRLLDKVLEDTPQPPSLYRSDIPEGLENIILRAMEKDPRNRYQTAEDFLHAIEQYEGTLVDEILLELNTTQRRMVKTMAVLETHRALSSSTSIDELLDIMLETAIREIAAERGTIFVLDKKRNILWSKILAGDKDVRIEVPLGKGIAGHVALTGEVLNIRDAYSDPRFNPEVDKETGYTTRTILTVPLFSYRGEIAGVLQLLNKIEGGEFNDEDADFVKEIGAHAATLLENAMMHEQTFDRLRVEKELQIAQEVQRKLLPGEAVRFPGLKIAFKHFGDNIIGGNYFDFIKLSESRLWLLLGDTSGAGLPAALLASNFQGAFRLLAEDSETLLPMVMRLNRHLCCCTDHTLSISACFLDYSEPTHHLTYLNAGHPPPLIIHPEGEVSFLKETGIALGVEHDHPFTDDGIVLTRSTLIALYTPGIVEADNGEGAFYGNHRLRMVLELNKDRPLEEILEVFTEDWASFRGTSDLIKDATLILAKCVT
ncbi:MAG TPA: SpoIIE family protein phosphatase [Thermoanaerobaculia bacterium]|nr:SpoIIE family protein phosphatase [Thermoanaerobaculia bacterium]HUM29915.1 SpoIIE family protein phosphatase [Thermoanaerobaculia bacterium]HXK68218.1 SpoIIE family protein phosphatase [Thermoanaerobaculia bacterium]